MNLSLIWRHRKISKNGSDCASTVQCFHFAALIVNSSSYANKTTSRQKALPSKNDNVDVLLHLLKELCPTAGKQRNTVCDVLLKKTESGQTNDLKLVFTASLHAAQH